MKKIILMLVLCILFSNCITAFAEEKDVTVIINGQQLQTPVPARIINGRTVLPMRVVFERLGAIVTWVEADRMIFATKDNTLMIMQIDNHNIAVQKTNETGKKIVELDVAPFVENGHTLVPVRAVAETLDAKVEWDEETFTVNIYK